MLDVTADRLKSDCELAAKLWGRTFSALTAMTFREKGEQAINELWFLSLTSHQTGHYREGLRKLGIPDDAPPAVAAGQYHYFTNVLGGLPMEYVEESPKKVWVRYLAPMWTYAGVTMLALPGRLRRTIMSSWHPRNGPLMGSKRLGWVATKFVMEGDPYDEGYFMEYDHDLRPDELMRWELAARTPECDYSKLPQLDPAVWPEPRLWKARRNYSGGYVRTPVEVLYRMFGQYVTHFIVGETMRCLAIQYIHELQRDTCVSGRDVASIASIFTRLLEACGQDFDFETVNDKHCRIVLRTFRPFDPDAPEALRQAFFQFQEMGTRILNGRVRVTRAREAQSGSAGPEIWDFKDTGSWLW